MSPWFWGQSVPHNLFELNIKNDIKEARDITTWERGKVSSSSNKLFVNWPTQVVNKRISVVMENLDIGNYFFAGHPRERVGIVEKQKFTIFELPLLIIGLTSSELRKYKKFLLIYISLVLLMTFVFEWRTFENTLPLSVPFVVIMALGIRKIFSWVKKYLF